MSVLLEMSFASLGLVAVSAILASVKRYGPQFAALRHALAATPPDGPGSQRRSIAIRPARALAPRRSRPLRHRHHPKPVIHRLHGRHPRRAAA